MTIKYVKYPPPLRPPGPQNFTSTEKPVEFNAGDVVLAHWIGTQGPSHLTMVGSSPLDQTDQNIIFIRAVVRIRRGNVTREDVWTWPCSGFIRRVVADEAWIIARAISQQPGQPFLLGGAVIEGILPDDGYVSYLPGAAIANGPPNYLYAPIGCREFRAWELGGPGGTIQFLNKTGDPNAPLATGIIYPVATFGDWTPWPSQRSGLYFYTGAAHVEFRT